MTRSTLDMAVLSVLLDGPGHRYEIGGRFVSRFYPLFRLSVQNVYPYVARLKDAGFVEQVDLDLDFASVKRSRQAAMRRESYRMNAFGGRSYREWLASPIPPKEAKHELFTRLRAVRPDDYGTMLALLDRFENAVLRSISLLAGADQVTIVDDFARTDHEVSIDGALRWSALVRERLLALIAAQTA